MFLNITSLTIVVALFVGEQIADGCVAFKLTTQFLQFQTYMYLYLYL